MPASTFKTRWPLLALTLALLVGPKLDPSSAVAHGQEQPSLKVAVVDLEILFVRSAAGQRARDEVKKLEDSTRQALEQEVEKGRQLEDSLPEKSPAEQLTIRRQMEDIERSIRRVRDDANRRAGKLEQDSREAFNETVQPIFEQIQTERGYDLILNKAAGVVIFAGPSVDVTEEMLGRLGGN